MDWILYATGLRHELCFTDPLGSAEKNHADDKLTYQYVCKYIIRLRKIYLKHAVS